MDLFGAKNWSKWPKIGPKGVQNDSKMGHSGDFEPFWVDPGSFWGRFGIGSVSFGAFLVRFRPFWGAVFDPFGGKTTHFGGFGVKVY